MPTKYWMISWIKQEYNSLYKIVHRWQTGYILYSSLFGFDKTDIPGKPDACTNTTSHVHFAKFACFNLKLKCYWKHMYVFFTNVISTMKYNLFSFSFEEFTCIHENAICLHTFPKIRYR